MGKTKIEFGSRVFNDETMQKYLPEDVYTAMKNTIQAGARLDESIANVVANAMKDWALEHGATHFTHWFQPMNGKTAEKHESFVSPDGRGGVLLEFSGKDLIRFEADGSSFPSGGLRYTAACRSYTIWDPTSYAFIKENTLCIPSALYSYTGDVLDKKIPLLRSMEALNKQAVRVLHAIGETDVAYVTTNVGPEQEYCLVDEKLYEQREDLRFCGRTLFGAPPMKGQELDDHYYAVLPSRAKAFMEELNKELWALGILSKTEHKEVAPSSYEMAPMFTTTNMAVDGNQLVMEMMQKVARRHGLVCLLHEKPYASLNGSGKHNNWSISTDKGKNLLHAGDDMDTDKVFLTFLIACVEAVDTYQDLLRISCASANNDHRLGAKEAPPALLSVNLGEHITEMLDCMVEGRTYKGYEPQVMQIGVAASPRIVKDPTERNRTSPFPFTGNRFEFRMVGSSFSMAGPNTVLNTIVADALCGMADELEAGADLFAVLKKHYSDHRRIVFNGNGYTQEWEDEAARRGLSNYRTTPEALSHFLDAKNVAVLKKHGIYTDAEIASRNHIWFENYTNIVAIEAATLVGMARKKIIPAVSGYSSDLAATALTQKEICGEAGAMEKSTIAKLGALNGKLYETIELLDENLKKGRAIKEVDEQAFYFCSDVFGTMQKARGIIDTLEPMVGADYWPYPTYDDLIWSVE